MVYTERNVWSGLVVSVVAVTIYVILMLQRMSAQPIAEVDWVWPMLWTIGLSIAATIVVSILWGIFAGMRDPEGATVADVRDRDIERMGDRVGRAFMVIAGIGVLVLCAFGAEHFWIANAMFLGFALSAIVGGIAQVIAYRVGGA